MRNLALTIKYVGTAYSGWQAQLNAPSIQQTLRESVEKFIGGSVSINGCSRTDAGVHANTYCCNFRTDSSLKCATVVNALNAYLPDDIVAIACEEKPIDFHARFDCLGKQYIYKIHNSYISDPFQIDRCWEFRKHIDEKLLNEQAQHLVGTHDFASFCSAGSVVKSTVRTVKSFSVARNGDDVIMSVEADGFLYNMVRIMVGTLTDITMGRIAVDEIPQIILAKDRTKAGVTAPPQGLYLNKVYY